MNEKRAKRLGAAIGKWVANALWFAIGFIAARNGWLWALATWGGTLLILLAIYGATKFKWSSLADEGGEA